MTGNLRHIVESVMTINLESELAMVLKEGKGDNQLTYLQRTLLPGAHRTANCEASGGAPLPTGAHCPTPHAGEKEPVFF